MAYVLESITNEDLLKILTDAKSDPKLDRSIQYEISYDMTCHRKWAVDRDNHSYLFHSSSLGLSDAKSFLDGYMFFYQNKVFRVYVNRARHLRNGIVGWVSLDRDFKSLPPQDLGFQHAFSEACYVCWGGRLIGKTVFSAEQQDKE
ncbi:hypothetical protein AGMMS49545_21730 [Betaproteobacteria bacterium]|nr:hypothetical protein AGMMS49545_21730 [Betaproteobacteria bacterium]GHU48708.1 hypothetical protein AGMMS50289_25570 [Betaproteobacteria bacterium]